MQILRTTQDLNAYLRKTDCTLGCLADTGFLYGASFDDDRIFDKSVEVHELLAENSIPIFANVISRMEFIDLLLRKQLTGGCVELFEQLERTSTNTELFNLLKNIRDNNTAAIRNNESYKISEAHIKKLRRLISSYSQGTTWKSFCAKYTGPVLVSEWKVLEEELGLNFVEITEGATSEFFHAPLLWNDMVQIMGRHGMRGPDAMIVNLFLKSNFSLLITSDSDFESTTKDSADSSPNKAVFVL